MISSRNIFYIVLLILMLSGTGYSIYVLMNKEVECKVIEIVRHGCVESYDSDKGYIYSYSGLYNVSINNVTYNVIYKCTGTNQHCDNCLYDFNVNDTYTCSRRVSSEDYIFTRGGNAKSDKLTAGCILLVSIIIIITIIGNFIYDPEINNGICCKFYHIHRDRHDDDITDEQTKLSNI